MSRTETSVALSLAELTRIEEERIEREKSERTQERAERARREREAEQRRHAEARAQTEAEEAERARQAREQAAERARNEARERAALEVARIQADAKVRLEADNAVRAHELALLATRRQTGRRRREVVLGVALAVVVAAAGIGAWDASSRMTKYERAAEELRERERALVRERDDAKRVELQSLERRHGALLARARAADAKRAAETASAARAAIDTRSPDHDHLRAFAESLDALDQRIDLLDEVALLDQRKSDLTTWASSQRRAARLEALDTAAARAKAQDAGADAVLAYGRALDRVAMELSPRAATGSRAVAGESGPGPRTCQEGDPGCGLDGRPLF